MSTTPAPQASDTHSRLLAWALFDLRLLLASHIGGVSQAAPEVRAAAELAYSLHNLALAAFDGRTFTETQFIEALARAERASGEPFPARFHDNMQRAGKLCIQADR